MIRLVILVIFVPLLSACAPIYQYQTSIPDSQKYVRFSREYSKSRGELHALSNEYIARTFYSANDVIQMNDKEAGVIVVKALYESWIPTFDSGYSLWSKYAIDLHIKENKINAEFITGTINGMPSLYLDQDGIKEMMSHYRSVVDDMDAFIKSSKSEW